MFWWYHPLSTLMPDWRARRGLLPALLFFLFIAPLWGLGFMLWFVISLPLAVLAAVWWCGFTIRKIIQQLRLQPPPRNLPPLLVVGNIMVGGGGKTPLIKMLCRYFPRAVVVVKNYRAPWPWGEQALLLNKKNLPSLLQQGHPIMDEALLHAQDGDVVLCRNRPAALQFIATAQQRAGQKKYDLVIIDDGLQDFSFTPDHAIITFPATYFSGGRATWLLPAGPLRQTWRSAMTNPHRPIAALVVIGDPFDKNNIGQHRMIKKYTQGEERTKHSPLANLFFLQRVYTPSWKKGTRLLAFAGIAQPRAFFTAIERLGGNLVAWRSFPDHHHYSHRQWLGLQRAANRAHARLITTEKDMVRLNPSHGVNDRMNDVMRDGINNPTASLADLAPLAPLTLNMTIKGRPDFIAFLKKRLYNKSQDNKSQGRSALRGAGGRMRKNAGGRASNSSVRYKKKKPA